jgi:hypothetical protein
MRVDPLANSKDLSAFANGSVKIHVSRHQGIQDRIKDGNGIEKWVTSSILTNFGLVLDGNWCDVSIPLSAFAGLDLSVIQQYFMFVADSGTGYYRR